jgi:hypothetical protein
MNITILDHPHLSFPRQTHGTPDAIVGGHDSSRLASGHFEMLQANLEMKEEGQLQGPQLDPKVHWMRGVQEEVSVQYERVQ